MAGLENDRVNFKIENDQLRNNIARADVRNEQEVKLRIDFENKITVMSNENRRLEGTILHMKRDGRDKNSLAKEQGVRITDND